MTYIKKADAISQRIERQSDEDQDRMKSKLAQEKLADLIMVLSKMTEQILRGRQSFTF